MFMMVYARSFRGILGSCAYYSFTKTWFVVIDALKQEFEDGNCVVKPMSDKDEFVLPFKKDPQVRIYHLGTLPSFQLSKSSLKLL